MTLSPSSVQPTDPRDPAGEADGTYRQLFERSPDALVIFEGDTFLDCNASTVRMLGYASKEQLLVLHPSQISPPIQPDGRDSHEKAAECIRRAFEEGSLRFEWDHQRADGEVFPVEVLLTVVHWKGRDVLHGVLRDLTERKRLEQQLQHALKMEAVGQLAGGIAHDFNNLLVAILGNTELLTDHVAAGTEPEELVNEIRHAAGRAGELTAQLLAFSRRQFLQPSAVDLNGVVRGLTSMLGRLLGEHIELRLDLAHGEVTTLVDAGQIEQVLVNLVANARDASRPGGQVTIETALVDLDQAAIGVDGVLPAGTYTRLSVSDTGSGMSPEVRRQAFDPFFTTKAVGEGTGLGLSTVYGIVRQSQGDVVLRSEPGRGTTFSIFLPRYAGGTRAAGAGLASDPCLSDDLDGDELVLLAEDEPAVSHLMARVLRSRGYRVVTASNGAEAHELYQAHVDELDLIVSDVVMPGLTGPAMVAALGQDRSLPPVLFVSGYTRNALRRMDSLGPGAEFLQKPFSATTLLRRVRGILDRAGSAEA